MSKDLMEEIEAQIKAKEEPQLLWACSGTMSKETDKSIRRWVYLFETKEEAEAHAVVPHDGWIWDKQPATPREFKTVMFRCRQDNDLGIAVVNYKEGKWSIKKKYPIEVPLQENTNGS